MRAPFLFAASLCLGLHSLPAQDLIASTMPRPEQVDATIPAPATPTGEPLGERHWYAYEIHGYLNALAEASPRMVALPEYARSHGGRPLRLYAIGRPENLARLDAIQQAQADARNTGAPPPRDHPAILNMGYGVHGDEPSASHVAPLVAYYLTASTAPEVEAILDDVLVLLDPLLNPDGHDRFTAWSHSRAGRNPSADPADREHRQLSPNGRTNFYGFDLNRDWLPHQHPSSAGRVAAFHRWKPHVLLDFHEMGTNSTYFFQPGVPERTNPLTPAANQELTAQIAAFHRAAFDAAGVPYFSQERFDDFYVGKGSTYPDLHGSIGILFEQGSARGMQQESRNGRVTFADAIAHQFRASLSSLDATRALRADLRDFQLEFWADARDAGAAAAGHYLAAAPHDPAKLVEFTRVLTGHGIHVNALTRPVEVDGFIYRPGEAIAIPTAQPGYPYLQTLWERRTAFAENIFYDVSAWTLPLAFDLQHTPEPYQRRQKDRWTRGPVTPETLLAARDTTTTDWRESAVGYLLDWRDSRTPALAYDLLEADANVRVATEGFSIDLGADEPTIFPAGTLFVSSRFSADARDEALPLLQDAVRDGLPVHPVGTSHTPNGLDLGSNGFAVLEQPQVALLVGAGMDQYENAEFWHLLDTRLAMPVTQIELAYLGSTDLDRYTVMLLGDGWGLRNLPDARLEQLMDWVSAGGVLWLQGDAVAWAIGNEWIEARFKPGKTELETEDGKRPPPQRRAFGDAVEDNAFKLVRGSIFAAHLDRTHPLGFGFPRDVLPMFRNKNRFLAPSENPYSTPVRYMEDPLLAGYISEDNLDLASDAASVIVIEEGAGAIVLCSDNPLFRAYWWGTQRLVTNAIFFGALLEEPAF